MENEFIYQLTIKLEDGLTMKVLLTGPENAENEIIEFYYNKYWEEAPDISKYSIVNLSKDPKHKTIFNSNNFLQYSLATMALEYAREYN